MPMPGLRCNWFQRYAAVRSQGSGRSDAYACPDPERFLEGWLGEPHLPARGIVGMVNAELCEAVVLHVLKLLAKQRDLGSRDLQVGNQISETHRPMMAPDP